MKGGSEGMRHPRRAPRTASHHHHGQHDRKAELSGPPRRRLRRVLAGLTGPSAAAAAAAPTISTRDGAPLPVVNRFGVSAVKPGFGVVPKKVFGATAEAAECLRRDGAVIVCGLPTDLGADPAAAFEDTARRLPAMLFGSRLLAATEPRPVGTDDEGERQRLRERWGDRSIQFAPWDPDTFHTDGVKSWGDYCPPYFFLFFADQSPEGGENALLDTNFLVDSMSRAKESPPAAAAAAQLLSTVPIDPTPVDDRTFEGSGDEVELRLVTPIVQTVNAQTGRRLVKMVTGGQRPAPAALKRSAKAQSAVRGVVREADRSGWDEEEAPQRDGEMISAFKSSVYAATAHCPRFKVMPGECLVVDNYRTWHMREPYSGLNRKAWRVWMWVEGDCYGVPAESSTPFMPPSVTDS